VTDSGSQTGSQQRQTLSDATRLPATIAAAKRLTGRHRATSRDPSTVPSKQRVAGSNPAWRASLNAFLALYSPCPEAKQALRKNHGLVFASAAGTPMDDHNVGRQFRVITEAVGLGRTWVPRALRHTFVSLLPAHRGAGGGDRAASRAQPDGHDGVGLPPSDRARAYPGYRGHGPDPRLADGLPAWRAMSRSRRMYTRGHRCRPCAISRSLTARMPGESSLSSRTRNPQRT